MGRSSPSRCANAARSPGVASSGSITFTGSPISPRAILLTTNRPMPVPPRGRLSRHRHLLHGDQSIDPRLELQPAAQAVDVVLVEQEREVCLVAADLDRLVVQGVTLLRIRLLPRLVDQPL